MAVTHITSGKSIKDAVDYVTKSKAHKPNKYIGTKRDLYDSAVNGATDPELFIKETEYQLKHNGRYHKGQVQEVRTIISFDPKQLSIKDPNAPIKAGKLARRITKQIYPHNASHITIQADGEGKNKYHLPVIHAHIITCARRLDNGKSITHDATFRKVQPQVDRIIEKSGYKALDSPYQSIDKIVNGKHKTIHVLKGSKHNTSFIARKTNERLEKQGKHGWIHQLSSILDGAKSQAKSRNQFMHLAYVDGVTVNPFRMKRVRGTKKHGQYQYQFHIYKSNKTKSGKLRKGHYVKIDDDLVQLLSHIGTNIGTKNLANNADIASHQGEYLRLSKQVKYSYQGKVVRAKKLGSVYDIPALEKTFKANAEHENQTITDIKQLHELNTNLKKSLEAHETSVAKSAWTSVQASLNSTSIPIPVSNTVASYASAANAHADTPVYRIKWQDNSSHPKSYIVKTHKHPTKPKNNQSKKFNLQSLHAYSKLHKVPQHVSYTHEFTAPTLQTLKPTPVRVYHAKPSSASVMKALNRVHNLTQKISRSHGKTKSDLILQKRDAMDKFDDNAKEYIDKMEQSRAEYASAKQTNQANLEDYSEKMSAFLQDQANKERANRIKRYRGGFGPEL